jgi:hypothetical protein
VRDDSDESLDAVVPTLDVVPKLWPKSLDAPSDVLTLHCRRGAAEASMTTNPPQRPRVQRRLHELLVGDLRGVEMRGKL